MFHAITFPVVSSCVLPCNEDAWTDEVGEVVEGPPSAQGTSIEVGFSRSLEI